MDPYTVELEGVEGGGERGWGAGGQGEVEHVVGCHFY